MYDNEKSSGLNIRSIIGKIIFLAIFVFLLIWLLPKVPNMTPFYSNVFRENISYMQNAAKSHFTNERMPQNVGESIKLSLQQMIDQNMIIPFVDKDGNACNAYESYVSVTKHDTDYTLKVNLVCEKEEKYVVETLGCYDKCEATCKTEEIKKITEYQFKKATKKTVTSCECGSGYVEKNGLCYKSITSTKIAATAIYESDSNMIYDAEVVTGKTTLSCADSTYTLNTTTKKCTKKVDAKYSEGSTYTYEYTVREPALTKTESTGSSCSTKKTTDLMDSCTWISSGFETESCKTCTGGTKQVWYNYYKCCTSTSKTVEYCADGSTPSNGYCTVTKKGIGTTSGGYSCSKGTLDSSGTKCDLVENAISAKEADTYKCEKSDDAIGSKCYRFIKGKFKYYECPKNQGYIPDGAFCYKITDDTKSKTCSTSTKTVNSYKWATTKTLSGWTPTGKTREVKAN